MTDSERLAAIEARANDPFGTSLQGISQVDDDRDWLLALVREQAAKLEATSATLTELMSEYCYGELHYSDLEDLRTALEARA